MLRTYQELALREQSYPLWGIKLILRLCQVIKQPGIYSMTIIQTQDGKMQLVIENGKVEDLGRKN